jgi:HNH endonuclease
MMVEAAFFALVSRRGPFSRRLGSRCWTWTRSLDKYGYGRCARSYQTTKAHRAAWILSRGPIPEGLCVLHRCDNPPCCNPAHLFLGTQLENIRDRESKRRNVVRSGEANGNARLTSAQVDWIRATYVPHGQRPELRGQGVVTLKSLAEACGVSISTIARVTTNQSRKAG